MAAARIVVFAIGNESRGDDALGPAFWRRLKAVLPATWAVHLQAWEVFQLQVEDGLDLIDADVVLFIDAAVPPAVAADQPFAWRRLSVASQLRGASHALHPSEVLWAAQAAGVSPLPEAWLLALRGEQFELGEGLSPAATAHMTQAMAVVVPWLSERLSKYAAAAGR